jgi:hypothetical protein
MIGRTEERAKPKILVCSMDRSARKEVRKAIAGSGVLNGYPTIKLGDISQLPDLLAQHDLDPSILTIPNLSGETLIYSPPSDNAFGRRLFILRPDSRAPRPATAGPMLYINGEVYQLTVGHAFAKPDDNSVFMSSFSTLDDCDFDDQSDSDEEKDIPDTSKLDVSSTPPQENQDHTGEDTISTSDISSGQLSPSSSAAAVVVASVPSGNSTPPKSIPGLLNQSRGKKSTTPKRLGRIGKLGMVSEDGPNPTLDYGVVKLEGKCRNDDNEMPFGPNGTQRWLRVLKAAKVGSNSVSVVTTTASSRFLSGKLFATASYMRLPNQITFQELYSVRLNGTLADGDCGSGILDQLGNFYGHIVAGTIGTGLAYIVPAVDVFQDIYDRMGADVTLRPPPIEHTDSKHSSKDRSELEPLRIIEFSSKKHFIRLSKFDNSDEDTPESQDDTAIDKKDNLRKQDTTKVPRRSKLAGPMSTWRSKVLNFQSKNSKPAQKSKENGFPKIQHLAPPKSPTRHAILPATTANLTFEENFSRLPSDLRAQIIASLSVPNILNLRTVSKRWLHLVSGDEVAISRDFLKYNPVPRFAAKLYPAPRPPEIDLHYISGMWHRLSVSSKLSAKMVEWISSEYFQLKSEEKRLDFSLKESRMRRRFIPIVFTIFHFFETYRHLHTQTLGEHVNELTPGTYNISQLEAKIMDMYDDQTLLQVQQVFPQFMLYLKRILRPPSYFGLLERSFRGYRKNPPSDNIFAVILYIGGLNKILDLSQIESYEARRTVADDWCNSVSRGSHKLLTSDRPPPGLDGWQWRRPSMNTSVHSTISSTSTTSAVFSTNSFTSNSHHTYLPTSSCSSITKGSVDFRQQTEPILANFVQQLLQDMPILQEIFVNTGERLLLRRGIVERVQDIKKIGQLIEELIRDGVTDADELIYGEDVQTIAEYSHLGWEGLIEGGGAAANCS